MLKGKIFEEPLSKNELLLKLERNYIILNVDSRILNNTKERTGHYVILKKEHDDISIINPEKTKYTEQKYKIQDILKMCEKYGNWRIEIRREK